MHVVFISNSTGKSAGRVRAVLDAYATRIGNAAWATPITDEALEEVRRAIKKGISRHTSVACYRNKGVGSMKLHWVIGNRNHYDERGMFAPETRSRKKEFAMPYRHAALVAGISGWCHDLGKANGQFQHKIGNSDEKVDNQSDGIRHEWISSWIFDRFVNGKASLPEAMATWNEAALNNIRETGWMPVNKEIASAPDAISLIISTHHHAFGWGDDTRPTRIRGLDQIARNNIHVRKTEQDQDRRLATMRIAKDDAQWAAHGDAIRKYLTRLEGIHEHDPDYWHGITLIARAAMILADHEVSSIDKTGDTEKSPSAVYANTCKKNGKRVLNQDLLWHLSNIGDVAKRNIAMFANEDLPLLPEETVERIMERSPGTRFEWQDIACDAMPQGPALVFNVASTGAGKTRANVKLICALRKGKNVRISSAFNLRSLTLQTFDAYSEGIGLEKGSECACLIGDPVVREIHHSLRDDETGETKEEDFCGGETAVEIKGLDKLVIPEWLSREADRVSGKDGGRSVTLKKLLAAPILVSTVDFLDAAGDLGKINADHAHALLRMAHSDLILDEIDSYDTDSTVAVLRLVHIAGMFGRNVVLSSATLSPTLAEYAQRAYQAGIRCHRAMFGPTAPNIAIVSDRAAPLIIGWSDTDAEDGFSGFDAVYHEYLSRMAASTTAKTKIFRVVDTGDSIDGFHAAIHESVNRLHEAHGWDIDVDGEKVKVSVGLVRMANINPCFEVAKRLIEANPEVHVVTYHAKEPLLRRTYKEHHFDKMLRRSHGNLSLEEEMRKHLRKCPERSANAIFVVIATPVEEVGRDHDFDWGIIEPSSMHSIMQTAGRVNRHRLCNVESANISIMNRCYRDVQKKSDEGRVFFNPGNEISYENNETSHPSHTMTELLGVGIHEQAELSIGMMFGQHQTEFAKCDEKSIRDRLESVIAKRIEPSGNLAWFSKWFGKAYPLRASSSTRTLAVLPDEKRYNRVRFKQYSYVESNHVCAWQWDDLSNADQSDCPNKPDRAWLSPSIQEVVEDMEKKLGRKITENDMSFQVFYGKDGDSGKIPISMDWRGVLCRESET
jgi:CRISPR-associated endonuclease/helicase Cas3